MAALKAVERRVDGSMYGFSTVPIPKVRTGFIGMGNRGKTLIQMMQPMIESGQAEVVSFCDLVDKKVAYGREAVDSWQSFEPTLYSGSEDEWRMMIDREDLDLVIICTPWEWHAPMAKYAMESGVHAACEVPIAYTMEDCWDLVETAERTRRHCIMLENCCYNEEELFVLNMIGEGVFGDVTHAEGAYLHDLRAHLLSQDYYQDQWRLRHHFSRDGNLYTTHGLGPIGFYLKIGRGDGIDHLVSMSSRERNLSQSAKERSIEIDEVQCGDINNTLLKTKYDKTILLQFDVHTGRPYSRINKVVGTKAVHDGYPSQLYIDRDDLAFSGHKWLSKEDYLSYRSKYMHPLIQKMKSISQNFKQGHGGMDFIMMHRLIRALNMGQPLDINVYDGVMWSAVTPLSEISAKSKSLSVPFPDFTGGEWEKVRSLQIDHIY